METIEDKTTGTDETVYYPFEGGIGEHDIYVVPTLKVQPILEKVYNQVQSVLETIYYQFEGGIGYFTD